MEVELLVQSAWKEAAMIPLPGSILEALSEGKIILREKMDQNWCAQAVGPDNGDNQPLTAAACLVKMTGVWYEEILASRTIFVLEVAH